MLPFKMNPYHLSRYIKFSLIITIFLFLLYTVIELLIIKQYYIRRYVELHYQYENNLHSISNDVHYHHHHDDDDEGILIPTNVDEEIPIEEMIIPINTTDNTVVAAGNQTTKQQQRMPKAEAQILPDDIPDESFENPNLTMESDMTHSFGDTTVNNNQVKVLSMTIVAGIILVEILYCVIYVYIIEQERFCPIFCFAILTFVSLLLRLRQFIFENNDEFEWFKYRSLTNAERFHHEIKKMDAEQLLDWMTKTDLIEVIISFIETILVFIYTLLLRRYPARIHGHPYVQYQQQQQQQQQQLNGQQNNHHPVDHVRIIPNGHAIEMNELSNTDGTDTSMNDQRQINVDNNNDDDDNGNQRLLSTNGQNDHSNRIATTIVMSQSCARNSLIP
ncbi:uncharacterized protein LOC124497333 [Dermatophagoides farinae]|uniref:Uncharacterized protein n=1 Tax=Dermatophagoides farinae TaxID=6954 RepID=A0A9D4NTI4_DERFA|nr:uncharacterized protein LOC124497333 [Dermatophagoides farinae]KAH7638073.1 hypothetical protein HUG17_9178 [Dermatophagoides farinae]